MTKIPADFGVDRRALVTGLIAAPLLTRRAKAEEFPSRPIRFIVPFGAGSVADIVGRKVGDKAGEILKTTFVIENRPGAGGSIGAQAVATAAPDGYTICLGTVASHAIAAAMEKLPYDPIKDFKPIALLVTTASLIVVNSSVPAKTLKEYLDYARKKGVSLYVSGGVATTTQLLPELIRVKLNVPLQHVPAAKVGDSYNDLVAGRVRHDVLSRNWTAAVSQFGICPPASCRLADQNQVAAGCPDCRRGIGQHRLQSHILVRIFCARGNARPNRKYPVVSAIIRRLEHVR